MFRSIGGPKQLKETGLNAGAKRRKAPAEKLLNARPCEVCERKMVARGIRRCYFTLSSTALGVLAYNPEPGDLPT